MPTDVVNLGYVVNVIEDPAERIVVLVAAWSLARKVLIVSGRLDWEATDAAVDFQGDGIVTGKHTIQKFFTQEELRQWIELALGRRPVAAAPGVSYVFRDEADAQSFAVNRVFRRRRIPDIEQCQDRLSSHRELVEPLMAFVADRGRLPVNGELATGPQLTQVTPPRRPLRDDRPGITDCSAPGSVANRPNTSTPTPTMRLARGATRAGSSSRPKSSVLVTPSQETTRASS